jgi:FAD binding domain
VSVDVDQLRAAIAGDVITPTEFGWDEARQAWNLTADQHPVLVVRADAVDDVLATVRFARANGLRVAPQSTGHGAAGLLDLTGTILLRTASLTGVDVDAEARVARVQSGARWAHVVAPAAQHGLACLHGFSGGVGVAGYTLGGGIGWLARNHGFASTHVRSFEVVTADGELRHVDAEHESGLFWALRGGGGAAAIVTELEFELFELREAFAGTVMWPIERAGEVVHTYRGWIATVPDSLTSAIRLARFPPVPEVPEPLRGGSFVAVVLALTADLADGEALVAPLRDVAAPYLDTLATVPAAALADIAGDPQNPTPGVGSAVLLDQFTAEAADTYVELAGPRAQTPFVSLEIRHLGGALRSATPDPGAAGPLAAQALVSAQAVAITPEDATTVRGALEAMYDSFAPWVGERETLPTFDEQGLGLRASLDSGIADRLAGIGATYDPDGLLVANQILG